MKRVLNFFGATVMLLSPLAAQTITVVSPAAGVTWCLGSTHAITWTKTGTMQATVAIRLRVAGSSESDPAALAIANGDANDGSYLWTIPNSLAPGNYFIRVRTDDSTVIGDSGVFTISACGATPTLTLTSPNGGESWARGSKKNITWSAQNWTGTVKLSLFKGGVFQGVIASSQPVASGKYEWEVGKTSKGLAAFGSDYRVSVARVYEIMPQQGLADRSDGDFSISVMRIEAPAIPITTKAAKTVSLAPSVANVWHRVHKTKGGGGFTSSSEPRPDPKPLMRTGYTNWYEGINPLEFDLDSEYWGYIYRGILLFDFGQIKGKVLEAKLSLQCTGTDSTDGVPYCDGSVMVLDGPGNGFGNPWHHLLDLPAMGGNVSTSILHVSGPNIVIVVTDLVKAWLDGSQPNHGLEFLGNNEKMDDESNDRCVSHFKVSLSVTYIPEA